jgi:hypothetical protein
VVVIAVMTQHYAMLHQQPTSPSGGLYWPNPQGCEAGRSAGDAADQLRVRHQPQDRALGLTIPETPLATADEVIQ